MLAPILRTIRYSRAWAASTSPGHRRDVTVAAESRSVPGTLWLPARSSAAVPGWVVLHGVTRPGRAHPALQRFCDALAASGVAVLAPEIPEWRELRLDPEAVQELIRASVLDLNRRPEILEGHVGLIGFSFGAPQALAASTHPDLRGLLRCVTGFGGYVDLERFLTFLFTGRHAWKGVTYEQRPDPYGRWIVGANYVTGIPEYEDAHDVASALVELAILAGERRIDSWDPSFDPIKETLRRDIDPERHALFDTFAPPADRLPDPERAARLVEQLTASAEATSPLVDPQRLFSDLTVPVRLIHGRHDHLVPFTETLRASASLANHPDARVLITGLFAHSDEGGPTNPIQRGTEAWRLFRGLVDVFGRV
jgi:pimeloyl-ACP methyl ester carboxylesterase